MHTYYYDVKTTVNISATEQTGTGGERDDWLNDCRLIHEQARPSIRQTGPMATVGRSD